MYIFNLPNDRHRGRLIECQNGGVKATVQEGEQVVHWNEKKEENPAAQKIDCGS